MMDSSSVFTKMLDSAIAQHPDTFVHFDRTKNIQSQLQAMVNTNINQVVKQVGITGCIHFKDITQMLCMSWEQLWLALVMKVLHSKSWNGEWVKE